MDDTAEGLVERRQNATINMLDVVWDPEEADRFVKLAQGWPALLEYDEDLLWKAIRETPAFWRSKTDPNIKAIRDRWPALSAQYLEGKE
jgi:hypothetical protein